jgi:hypothetical protein
LGFPSASTWIEFESVPASRRAPTSNNKNLFTMELLFVWIGKFNRGNVGFNWAVFAQNQKWYGFLKSEKMTLRSALEDLLETTLAGVVGIAGKVEYVASLRDTASGAYSHWGLTRAYGEPAAQHALAEAHRLVFLGLLRTPLRTLRDDVIVSSGVLQIPAGEYVERLRNCAPALLPPDLGGGSARHFSSVLQALSILLSEPVKTPSEPIPPT